MNNDRNKKRNFCSRASLAKPKNSHLSYKERLALANNGQESKGIDFTLPINSAGYITVQ